MALVLKFMIMVINCCQGFFFYQHVTLGSKICPFLLLRYSLVCLYIVAYFPFFLCSYFSLTLFMWLEKPVLILTESILNSKEICFYDQL